jgi:two-component system phosphate regulon sensor histidine kinase PhoR
MQQVLVRVAYRLEQQEGDAFYKFYEKFADSTGRAPMQKELLPMYDAFKAGREETVIYSDMVTREYDDDDVFFEKEKVEDAVRQNAKRNTGITQGAGQKAQRDKVDRHLFLKIENYLVDFREYNYLESWLTEEKLHEIIASELSMDAVDTPFEFGIYNNNNPTKIRSAKLSYDPGIMEHTVFADSDGNSKYRLLISFPEKKAYLFMSILGITSLSLVFTLIIIIAYLSAINQLIKQKQISEIKTDFINNMTHEFKTPIATINLALDAIKNPKIFEDATKVQRYLGMIREENKRMHSQVENVLQISKLDKRELDIDKEATDVHDIIDVAIEHVNLIIEARHGTLTRHLDARRTTALLNDVHFTNVLVNILDNAIKYSPDEPVIDVYTENVKDFILIKIRDRGLGMNKQTQKKIFEKFYREHTGDIHNVKGHGLGLAYVKRIIEDHNCHIYVESEKGKGSTFIIKMPLIN